MEENRESLMVIKEKREKLMDIKNRLEYINKIKTYSEMYPEEFLHNKNTIVYDYIVQMVQKYSDMYPGIFLDNEFAIAAGYQMFENSSDSLEEIKNKIDTILRIRLKDYIETKTKIDVYKKKKMKSKYR